MISLCFFLCEPATTNQSENCVDHFGLHSRLITRSFQLKLRERVHTSPPAPLHKSELILAQNEVHKILMWRISLLLSPTRDNIVINSCRSSTVLFFDIACRKLMHTY